MKGSVLGSCDVVDVIHRMSLYLNRKRAGKAIANTITQLGKLLCSEETSYLVNNTLLL